MEFAITQPDKSVVYIVRCKNCMFCDDSQANNNFYFCKFFWHGTDPYGFCHKGKPKPNINTEGDMNE